VLLHLESGLDYGYPDEGSFGPFQRTTGFALGPIYAIGSAGITFVSDDELLVGACGRIISVKLDDGAYSSRPTGEAIHTFDTDTCVTALTATPDGSVLAAAYGPNIIYVVEGL
jgi:hypothetical protein